MSYFNAVHSLVGGKMVGPTDGPVAEISFRDNQTPPTEEAVQAEIVKLQAEYDAQEYARNRKEEYPEIADQLDMIYWDGINETTTHKDAIEAIKAKYPKP